MIILEIPNAKLVEDVLDNFFETVDHIMVNENHIHKYPGSEIVVDILNEICREIEISMKFFDDEHGIYMESTNIEKEIYDLNLVLKKFRRRYRMNKRKS